jgi:hypothetical protein
MIVDAALALDLLRIRPFGETTTLHKFVIVNSNNS